MRSETSDSFYPQTSSAQPVASAGAGDGAIVRVLEAAGHQIVASNIEDAALGNGTLRSWTF